MKTFKIKITGSGTQEEITKALRDVANSILGAGAGNPNLATNELDDAEWEDSTLQTKIDLEEVEEILYILGEETDFDVPRTIYTINGVSLNDKISQEELHEYSITERTELIDELIRWIAECGYSQDRSSDKTLMQNDLEMLMARDETYLFTSNSTNSYIFEGDSEFNETCKELLEINKTLS